MGGLPIFGFGKFKGVLDDSFCLSGEIAGSYYSCCTLLFLLLKLGELSEVKLALISGI